MGWARYYDPTTGRFLSEDPIGFTSRDANPYRYIGNSPTNGTDPSGLEWYKPWTYKSRWWPWRWFVDDSPTRPQEFDPKAIEKKNLQYAQLLCETNSTNVPMRQRAQFRGEWEGAALDAAQQTSVEIAVTGITAAIPGPEDDFLARANRARKLGRLASKADEAECLIAPSQLHHLATNKNWISTLRGGPWSPRFEAIFKKAGMTLEDAANKAPIPGRFGPHPEEYHAEIFRRLRAATNRLKDAAYRKALLDELEAISREALTPGSLLHRLLTGGAP